MRIRALVSHWAVRNLGLAILSIVLWELGWHAWSDHRNLHALVEKAWREESVARNAAAAPATTTTTMPAGG